MAARDGRGAARAWASAGLARGARGGRRAAPSGRAGPRELPADLVRRRAELISEWRARGVETLRPRPPLWAVVSPRWRTELPEGERATLVPEASAEAWWQLMVLLRLPPADDDDAREEAAAAERACAEAMGAEAWAAADAGHRAQGLLHLYRGRSLRRMSRRDNATAADQREKAALAAPPDDLAADDAFFDGMAREEQLKGQLARAPLPHLLPRPRRGHRRPSTTTAVAIG